ncbi:hypothetical protein OH687_35655 [Burkholderia anthina]|nr:hypothetical protein OH687_35655 [Burkholderia anthina]
MFVPISSALLECDSRGVIGSDFGPFRYERLARPVYPHDDIVEWPSGTRRTD